MNTNTQSTDTDNEQPEQLESIEQPTGAEETIEVVEGGEDAALNHDENSHDESFAITNGDEQAGEAEEIIEGSQEQAESTGEEPAGDPAALNPGVQDQSQEQQEQKEEPAPVPPVAEAAPAPVAAPVTEQPTPVAEGDLSDAMVYLNRIRESGEPIQRLALEGIEHFCKRMPPRAPIQVLDAIAAKRDFLDLMVVILRKEYEEFRRGWSTLLVYFAAHHGNRPTASNYSELSEYSTNRYLDEWNDDLQAEAFMSLVTLLRITRNTETRKHDVKRIRLEAVAPDFLSARARDNLVRFYS